VRGGRLSHLKRGNIGTMKQNEDPGQPLYLNVAVFIKLPGRCIGITVLEVEQTMLGIREISFQCPKEWMEGGGGR